MQLLMNCSLNICGNDSIYVRYPCTMLSKLVSLSASNSLATLLSSGGFCSLVSKLHKIHDNSITRPSNTMYDTKFFSLGYGLLNAPSFAP